MKTSRPNTALLSVRPQFVKKCLATTILASLLALQNSYATNLYWDSNGTTTGAGTTPTGIWGSSAFWTTSPSGTGTPSAVTTTSADSLRFSAGSDTSGAYTVTVSGTQDALQVRAFTGDLILSGGTIRLAQTGSGTALDTTTTNGTPSMTVNSTLAVTNSAAGSYLIIDPFAGTTITVNGTVTASSATNSTFIQAKNNTGTVNINSDLGTDANLKAALQLGAIVGGKGTLNLNGNQTLGTAGITFNDATRLGTVNLGSSVNTSNAVQVGAIQMFNTTGNMTGAILNMNSAVTTTGISLRSGAAVNVAGSLTNTGSTGLGLATDTIHGATLKILNGGTASLKAINLVDGSVLTNAGTLTGTTLTLGEATSNTSGKLVLGDATGTGDATFTQITTLGTGTANAIVGGNASTSTLTLNLSADATYSGKLGGTGANENNLAFVKQSSPTLTLSGLNTYTGATTINAGTLKAGVATTGASGAFGNNSAVTLANVASAKLDTTGFNNSIGSLAGGGATGGNVVLGAATLTVGGNDSSTSFGGIISGTNGSLTKAGAGEFTLTGANTYTGNTTISAGTLTLGAASRIAATSNLVMAGGTFATGGFSQTLGTLSLTANSTIDLGAGISSLVFGDSSGIAWTSSVGLSFMNYTAGTDSIRVGTSSAGLTGAQLSQITINGFGASIDGNGFLSIAAIPEPATFALGLGLFCLGARISRRNRRPKAPLSA